jgi:hypothetical protein
LPCVKRPGWEAESSPQSCTEAKNGGAIPLLPHTFCRCKWENIIEVDLRNGIGWYGLNSSGFGGMQSRTVVSAVMNLRFREAWGSS